MNNITFTLSILSCRGHKIKNNLRLHEGNVSLC